MRIIVCLLFLNFFGRAQDTILFKDGRRVPAKINEVTTESIKYKRLENPEGPNYTVNKESVRFIHYGNGYRENVDSIYTSDKRKGVVNQPLTVRRYSGSGQGEMYNRGMADANKHYRHPGGAVVTGVITSLHPGLGLIPAFICSNVKPAQHNLSYPSEQLWQNEDYRSGYIRKARSLKRKKVWRSYGVGCGVFFVWVYALVLTNS